MVASGGRVSGARAFNPALFGTGVTAPRFGTGVTSRSVGSSSLGQGLGSVAEAGEPGEGGGLGPVSFDRLRQGS